MHENENNRETTCHTFSQFYIWSHDHMTYLYSLPNVVSNWARPLCPGLHSSVQFLCLSSLPITLTSISIAYFLWKPDIRRKNLFNILPLTYVRSLENYHDTLKVQTAASLIQTLHSHWTLLKKFSKCQIKTIVSSSWDLLKEYWSKGNNQYGTSLHNQTFRQKISLLGIAGLSFAWESTRGTLDWITFFSWFQV